MLGEGSKVGEKDEGEEEERLALKSSSDKPDVCVLISDSQTQMGGDGDAHFLLRRMRYRRAIRPSA